MRLCAYVFVPVIDQGFWYFRDEAMLVCLEVLSSAENVQEIPNHNPTGWEPRRRMKKNWSSWTETTSQLLGRLGELQGGLLSK